MAEIGGTVGSYREQVEELKRQLFERDRRITALELSEADKDGLIEELKTSVERLRSYLSQVVKSQEKGATFDEAVLLVARDERSEQVVAAVVEAARAGAPL